VPRFGTSPICPTAAQATDLPVTSFSGHPAQARGETKLLLEAWIHQSPLVGPPFLRLTISCAFGRRDHPRLS
jgi:hypothetical protein